MLTPWKVVIVRYLRSPETENLQNELAGLWPEIHPDDKQHIYQFLYLSRQWRTFIYFFIKDISEGSQKFPWLLFLTLIYQSKIELPQKHNETVKQGLRRQKLRLKEVVSLKDTIQRLMTKKRYAFLQEVQEKKQELLSSAKIARSEQLYEKQVDYLNQLKLIFPSDDSVKQIISEREKFNAEQAFAKLSRIKKKKTKKRVTLSEEEKSLLHEIKTQAKAFYKKDSRLANDFSIMFRNFGDYTSSIHFIQKGENEVGRDWQLLDLYLIGRQHVDLLTHCDMMKIKYANQPNALFSISYAEALAYWELGEKSKAIQLMSQIASMKPDFKSANEILTQWKEESVD